MDPKSTMPWGDASGASKELHDDATIYKMYANMQVCLDNARNAGAALGEAAAVISSYADKQTSRIRGLLDANVPLHHSYLLNSQMLQVAQYMVVWTLTTITTSPHFQMLSKSLDILSQFASYQATATDVKMGSYGKDDHGVYGIYNAGKKIHEQLIKLIDDAPAQPKLTPAQEWEAFRIKAQTYGKTVMWGAHPIAAYAAFKDTTAHDALEEGSPKTDHSPFEDHAAIHAIFNSLADKPDASTEEVVKAESESGSAAASLLELFALAANSTDASLSDVNSTVASAAVSPHAAISAWNTLMSGAEFNAKEVVHNMLNVNTSHGVLAQLSAHVTSLSAQQGQSADPFAAFRAAAATKGAANVDVKAERAKAIDITQQLDELREHLGWAHDGFTGIQAWTSTLKDQRFCVQKSMVEIESLDPHELPKWFIDWYFVMYTTQRTLWQMTSLAIQSPVTGMRHADGLFRVTMQYLTLMWQAHAQTTAVKFGGYPGGSNLWEHLSQEDFLRAIPG